MTLPVNISTAKTAVQERAAKDLLGDYAQYRREVLSSDDVDAMRKLVEMQIRLIGAETDKKQDQNAHLPTFNFVFHHGGVQATVQQVEVVQPAEAPGAPSQALPTPSPATPATPPTLDLDDLLTSLDADLQGT